LNVVFDAEQRRGNVIENRDKSPDRVASSAPTLRHGKNIRRLTERNHDLFRLAMMQPCAQQKKQLSSCSFEYRCSGESAMEDAWPAAQFANSPYYRL